MSRYRIPFNKPGLVGQELEFVAQAIEAGHISGDGAFTARCRSLLEEALGVPHVLLTTSCTHALEMCALLLDLKPGDEVILPAFTFVSTANAFALRGARPVFADICADTLNLDPDGIEALIGPRTRAIVCVHYAGVACQMDAIVALGARHGVPVIEDNAHGLFGRYRGNPLGTFGCLATLSFHETKNFNCGEGGALLINDPEYLARAEVLREKGTDRGRFFRGEVEKYTWVGLGSSYLPSDMLAAYLYAQLRGKDQILASRRRVWDRYHDALGAWADRIGARQPSLPGYSTNTYHMYYLLMPSQELRDGLIDKLLSRGILSVFHYQPLHLSEMGRRFGGREGQCPVTEDVSGRVIRLPFYNDLSPSLQDEVIQMVCDFGG